MWDFLTQIDRLWAFSHCQRSRVWPLAERCEAIFFLSLIHHHSTLTCAETLRGRSALLFILCIFFPLCKVYKVQNGQCPGTCATETPLLRGCWAARRSRDLASVLPWLLKKKRCVISLHKLYLNSLAVDRLPSDKTIMQQVGTSMLLGKLAGCTSNCWRGEPIHKYCNY